jgi:uncharacterized protein YutE (UPF0331/DUF86 family)
MKIDEKLILKRFERLDELLVKLNELKKLPRKKFLSNYKNYFSAQRALEIAINICIDIGAHIVSMNKVNKPETYSKIFIELFDLNIIGEDLQDKLIKMVKFRNLLGHFYMDVDNEIIFDIIQNNLEDFKTFKKTIFHKFEYQLSS